MSWAKLPSAWLRPRWPDPDEEAVRAEPGPEPSERDLANYPLAGLKWRKDGSSSMAALMILIALAIRRNQAQKGREFEKGSTPNKVATTYSDLQRMTGFARASVRVGTGFGSHRENGTSNYAFTSRGFIPSRTGYNRKAHDRSLRRVQRGVRSHK